MINYTKIPGYDNLGECELFSHLYQFIAIEPDENNLYNIIFIRAYDQPPTLWHGLILAKSKKCIFIEKELDLTNVERRFGSIEVIRNFKEFLTGHSFEDAFNDFTFTE